MMAVKWPQHGDRVVIGCAKYQNHTPFGQSDQKVVGIRQAMTVGDDDTNIVKWNPPHFAAIGTNDHEAARQRKVPVIGCYFDNSTDHDNGPGS